MFESFKSKVLVLLAAVVIFAMTATAGTVTIQITSAPVNNGTYGVGLYGGTVNGVPTEFVCDDFQDEVTLGQSWQATVGNTLAVNVPSPFLFSTGGQAGTAAAGLTAQQDYNAITFLADQIFLDPLNGDNQWATLSEALWSLNSPTAYSLYGSDADVSADIDLALFFDDTPLLPGDAVYTPVPGGGGQEFLSYNGNGENQTPEPASLVLLGTALIGSARLLKKKLFV